VELCNELVDAIIPTILVPMLFADLLYILLHFQCFFILVHVTFFSSRYMLELKFAMYYKATSLPHRLPMQCWLKNHWPDQAFFKHSPPRIQQYVFLIQHSCVIITFRC